MRREYRRCGLLSEQHFESLTLAGPSRVRAVMLTMVKAHEYTVESAVAATISSASKEVNMGDINCDIL